MELNLEEALGYLGIRNGGDEALRSRAQAVANRLTSALRPRYVYKIFPLEKTEEGFVLQGAGITLPGRSAATMLASCQSAVLLACTLGAGFDAMLRSQQARDMADAVLLDACGGAYVEAGCDEAEGELAARLPGVFFTDRFSPGYGDLPLEVQVGLCQALETEKRLGLYVTESLLLNPVKSVTAVLGVSDRPQMARIRGCEHCSMQATCALRKGGKRCGFSL